MSSNLEKPEWPLQIEPQMPPSPSGDPAPTEPTRKDPPPGEPTRKDPPPGELPRRDPPATPPTPGMPVPRVEDPQAPDQPRGPVIME